MRTRTKWLMAGGAAAFVLTPIAAVAGSTSLDVDLPRSSVLIDAQPSATADPTAEPSGKKTVSAASPVSPHTSPSPVSPRTPE